MRFPKEKSEEYTIAATIAVIFIFVVIDFISRAFISYPTPDR